MDLANPFCQSLDPNVLADHPVLRDYLTRLGETPLIEVPGPPEGGRVFAKLEWHNPNGTVKDRVAFAMVYHLLAMTPRSRRDRLHILEYSGGSLAIALSSLCRDMQIPLTLVLPSSTPAGIVSHLRLQGAELCFSPAELAFWGVMETTQALAGQNPHWSFLFQHRNPANLWMHRETTGREILEQLPAGARSKPLAWVASTGTGGTLIGVYEALSKAVPGVQLVVSSPAELPYGTILPPNDRPRFLGSGGFGLGRRQPFVSPHESAIDGNLSVTYDESLRGITDLYRSLGLRVGSSAAANWLVAKRVAHSLGPQSTVVTVFPSATPESELRAIA